MSVASMFTPPEQAGCLLKKGHSRGAWKERYFVLKVSAFRRASARQSSHMSSYTRRSRGEWPGGAAVRMGTICLQACYAPYM